MRFRSGTVLIVGAGSVGGGVALELAYMGVTPLWVCDYKNVDIHNLVRQPHSAEDIGKNKAEALAGRIHRDFPPCNVVPIPVNFMELSRSEQLAHVRRADLVVAATDQVECQRRINEICLEAEVIAVYPGVWVDHRVRDAEVGEVLWVLPGRHTPCYECHVLHRQGEPDAEAARGARLDIQQIVLATAQVVRALLDPTAETSAILDPGDPARNLPPRTLVYVHGLTPTSPGIRAAFPAEGLFSRNLEVHFPPMPCPACGGQMPLPGAQGVRTTATAEFDRNRNAPSGGSLKQELNAVDSVGDRFGDMAKAMAYEQLTGEARREVDAKMHVIAEMAKSHGVSERLRDVQGVVPGGDPKTEEFQLMVDAMHERLGLADREVSKSEVNLENGKKGVKEVWRSSGFLEGGEDLGRHIAVYETHELEQRRWGRTRRGPATRLVVIIAPGDAFDRKTGLPTRSVVGEEGLMLLPAASHGGGLPLPKTTLAEWAIDSAAAEYMRMHPEEFEDS